MTHRFNFFRAGGIDQVSLSSAADMLALEELDQKLWVALAMPTKGIDIDPDTLSLLDGDGDGRVRVLDILAAVAWAKATFKKPDELLASAETVNWLSSSPAFSKIYIISVISERLAAARSTVCISSAAPVRPEPGADITR